MIDARISEGLILRQAALINEIEDVRQQANDDLKTAWADMREELKALGLKGHEITQQVGYLKGAIVETRQTEIDRQKADEKQDGIAAYVALLSRPRARARKAAAEPDHDPQTGEVIEHPIAAPGSSPAPAQPDEVAPPSASSGDLSPDPRFSAGTTAAGAYQGALLRAQNGEAVNAVSPVGAATADRTLRQEPQAVTFQRKPYVLRPNCRNRDNCAGSGRNHCHSCRKAIETEAA